MDKIIIKGKSSLSGSLNVHGSKNATLPILVSSLLNLNDLILTNFPNVDDTKNMLKLLNSFGVKINKDKNKYIINSFELKNITADYDIVRKMRASILILGPLLSRFGYAKISLPGGCAIGTRPIDIHLEGLSKLGASFKIENGFVIGKVDEFLVGTLIELPFPSVGATENIIMASVLAKGETTIKNAAMEPEIEDLCICLNSMGANIQGFGTSTININGVAKLYKSNHKIVSDRIVAGTYIIAAVMLNSRFEIKNLNPNHLVSLIDTLKIMGANIHIKKSSIIVDKSYKLQSAKITTLPYPGFPTDLQAQIMALMCLVNGNSVIKETIFENRFMHVPELNRLGAKIKVIKDTAYIKGNQTFKAAQVMASDLRASVSLILAGLCAEGETTINRVYHLDRGYEPIEKMLSGLGPDIRREKK